MVECKILLFYLIKLFFLTESNSFISLYASSGKSSNCFLTYAILYATTFPPLLSTFPPLLSTFPPLLFRFLHYFLILIPSSVVTNLMQFQGMGTHPSVFSINKKRICNFEHSSNGGGGIRTYDPSGPWALRSDALPTTPWAGVENYTFLERYIISICIIM